MASAVEVQKEMGPRKEWSILFLLSTAFIATSLNFQGFPALMPFLQEEFYLTRTQVGLYSTVAFASSTLIAIFTGRLVDLKGVKWSIIFGVLYLGFFMILHSLAPSFLVLLALGFFVGFGHSILTPAVNKGVAQWFSLKKRATAMGIVQSGFGIGGFLGASLLPLLASSIGWRNGIVLTGSISLLVGFFIKSYYRDPVVQKETKSEVTFQKDLVQLLRNRYFLLLSLLGIILSSFVGSVTAHFSLFLYQDYSLSRAAAGMALGIFQLGGILGRPFWGYVSDRFFHGNRNRVLLLIGLNITLMALIFGVFLHLFSVSLTVLFLLSFLLGMTLLGWFALYATTIAEQVEESRIGTAIGLNLTFIRLGIIFGPPIFGLLADMQGSYRISWVAFGVNVLIFSIVIYSFTQRLFKKHP